MKNIIITNFKEDKIIAEKKLIIDVNQIFILIIV